MTIGDVLNTIWIVSMAGAIVAWWKDKYVLGLILWSISMAAVNAYNFHMVVPTYLNEAFYWACAVVEVLFTVRNGMYIRRRKYKEAMNFTLLTIAVVTIQILFTKL